MDAIAQGLFTEDAEPRLIGGRDRESGRVVFPCPPGDRFEPVPLPSDGTLWSFTVQRFRPKTPPYAGPDAFKPWIVAYVDLGGTVIVEARLDGVDPSAAKIGMPVRFAPGPLDPARPDERLIPAYVPAGEL